MRLFGKGFFGVAALAVLLAACSTSGQASPSSTTPGSPGPGKSPASHGPSIPAGNAIFVVVKPDGSQVPFDVDALKKLPLVSIMSDGQPQEGPALSAVLNAAGITDFSSVTVASASSSATISKAQVTNDLILDFNNRGSVKLVSPSMAKPQRIIDVTKITVK